MVTKSIESFIDRHAGGERAVLLQVYWQSTLSDEDVLAEFVELVDAAGVTNLACVEARRERPDPKYFIGSGKAEELQRVVKDLAAEVVVINHELTAAQGRNLETLLCCRVIDRTELILAIFASRARSFEGQLQVELAQLEHLRTRLIRGWTHLERQKGGIGLRGPGETQLETDRRLLDVRIKTIKKKLDKVARQRDLSRAKRAANVVPTVSLIGYTNAGKSTLFNTLTNSDAFAADQLFATLDPTMRQYEVDSVGTVILADTVGFIRDLPHDLVAAFRATLEEARHADLLLHVVDASHPQRRELIARVNEVVERIGAADVPQLLVFNKIDRCGEPARIEFNGHDAPQQVWMSALSATGVLELREALSLCLSGQRVQTTVTLTPEQGKLRARLYALGAVKGERYNAEGDSLIDISLSFNHYQQLFTRKKP